MKRSVFPYKQAISQYWLQTLQSKTNSYKLQHIWYILEQKLYWLVETRSTLAFSHHCQPNSQGDTTTKICWSTYWSL